MRQKVDAWREPRCPFWHPVSAFYGDINWALLVVCVHGGVPVSDRPMMRPEVINNRPGMQYQAWQMALGPCSPCSPCHDP
jgi:hypothetical protein